MTKNFCITLSILLAGVFLFLTPTTGEVQEAKAEGLAVALIIDGSGSMKNNDPDLVRIEAAKKVVSMLGENDQVTAVEFSDRASVIIPLSKAGDTASRNSLNSKLSAIGTKGDTDIKGGLESAFNELSKADDSNKKVAILLSDGEPDLPALLQDQQKMAAYLADVEKLAGVYKNRGWTVNCIALQREEAGQTLKKIAQTSGGEYFFVEEASELTKFFQSILLVQKYSEEEKPELSYTFENRTYKVGEKFKIFASLKFGEDILIPGPYLKLDKFILAVHIDGQEPLLINMHDDGKELSGDGQAGDGVFSALADCALVGEAALTVTAQGTYRNQVINEQVELGKIKVNPEFSTSEMILIKINKFILDKQRVLEIACAATAAILILIILYIRKNKRDMAKIKGSLQYWAEGTPEGATNGVLDISGAGKNEVLISTDGNVNNADFVLPALKRPFSLRIKKFTSKNANADDIKEFNLTSSAFYYWVICLSGTYLVSEGTPKSRQQIFHEDQFSTGGYNFRFVCKEAKGKSN